MKLGPPLNAPSLTEKDEFQLCVSKIGKVNEVKLQQLLCLLQDKTE